MSSAKELIKGFEGKSKETYGDQGGDKGVKTIGYGHTGSDVKPG